MQLFDSGLNNVLLLDLLSDYLIYLIIKESL